MKMTTEDITLEKAISEKMDAMTEEEVKEGLQTMMLGFMSAIIHCLEAGMALDSKPVQTGVEALVTLRKGVQHYFPEHKYTEAEKEALYKMAMEAG